MCRWCYHINKINYMMFDVNNKEHKLAGKTHEVAGMLLCAKPDDLVLPNEP